ncbi:hypothetical protein RvY_15577-1 [Ramazzottius varieornatus]|uniref:BACK domain-containing protein n=1 Tax=Ramazzottius varieornatus TaxID=947166 RepID=A0A1D1W266_RAMVA|nr:hypothetical protein RvY_15577-1 [Ramazzottius varieornatus]
MPGFLLWDIEKVTRLLSNDHIVIETEVHVFVAAMRWMQYKEKERRQNFKVLMDCVRWVYMSTEDMMNCIDQEQDLLKQADIRVLLIDANWYLTLEHYHFVWKDYIIPLPRIRSLRKEDPEEVVNRMRVSLVAKHSSMDHIWKTREAATAVTKDRPSSRAAVYRESSKKEERNKEHRQAASLPASNFGRAGTADGPEATPRRSSDRAVASSPKTAPSPNHASTPHTAPSPKVPQSPVVPPDAKHDRPESGGKHEKQQSGGKHERPKSAGTARSRKREKEEKKTKAEPVEESPAKSPKGEKFTLFKKNAKKKGR